MVDPSLPPINANPMRKILFAFEPRQARTGELSLTFMRISIGLIMALAHGLNKVPPSDDYVKVVADLGFPMPGFFALAAGLTEFLGGLFIAVGFLTRPSALFLAFTMFIAAFVKNGAGPFKTQELAILFLIFSLFFVARGAGRYSIDRYIQLKK